MRFELAPFGFGDCEHSHWPFFKKTQRIENKMFPTTRQPLPGSPLNPNAQSRGSKPKNVGGGWKRRLATSCLDETRRRRAKMITNKRLEPQKIDLPEIIRQEFDRLHQTNKDETELGGMSSDEYESLLLMLQSEISREEREEEEILLAQAPQNEEMEDVLVVRCPVCQEGNLMQNRSVIFCHCGIHLDTKHDGLNLGSVHDQILKSCQTHSLICRENPEFFVLNKFGIEGLYLSCSKCQSLDLIL